MNRSEVIELLLLTTGGGKLCAVSFAEGQRKGRLITITHKNITELILTQLERVSGLNALCSSAALPGVHMQATPLPKSSLLGSWEVGVCTSFIQEPS